MKCPKCAYVRLTTDAAPSYECPKCGIVYEKYKIVSQIKDGDSPFFGTISKNASDLNHNRRDRLQMKIFLALVALALLASLGYLITPLIPFFVISLAGIFWLVFKAIEGSREQQRREDAKFESLPFQHCMTCGHDFKHRRSALRGSTTMEIALWIFLLWPIALIYSVWRRLGADKAKVACIVCASTQVVPATSPAAVAHKRTLGV